MINETKVLFVCLGNICRSACAEAILKKKLADRGVHNVIVDSAGTSSCHEGEGADQRMIKFAKGRGYDITSISRPVTPNDFKNYDIIFAMDDTNLNDLFAMARGKEEYHKIFAIVDFSKKLDNESVPDPYYGGDLGFSNVIDILEDSCEGIIDSLNEKNVVIG